MVAVEAEGKTLEAPWASGGPAGSWWSGSPAWKADWFVQPEAYDPHPHPVWACGSPGAGKRAWNVSHEAQGRTVPVGPASGQASTRATALPTHGISRAH